MSSYGLQVQRTLDGAREQMRKAQQVGEWAQSERTRLAANPDGTRGSATVDEYAKSITESAQTKISAHRKIGMDQFAKAREELRALQKRAATYADADAANHAYLHRVKPLLDSGTTTIGDAITFFVVQNDPDALAGLHRHAPAYLAAKAGGNPNDPQVSMAVSEVVASIERAQEGAGFIDSELREYRALDRAARGLADEFDAMVKLAMTQASRDLKGEDELAAGYAIADARKTAAGEQP